MARIVLKSGMDRRLRAGHPWIYRTEIADLVGRWSAAEAVDVVDSAGHFLGRGLYNPRPSLACRIVTRASEAIDQPVFLRRLTAAFDYRRSAGLVVSMTSDSGALRAVLPAASRARATIRRVPSGRLRSRAGSVLPTGWTV